MPFAAVIPKGDTEGPLTHFRPAWREGPEWAVLDLEGCGVTRGGERTDDDAIAETA